MRKRLMSGLRPNIHAFAAIGEPDASPLSHVLDMNRDANVLFLVGPLAAMSREFVTEPITNGWTFARSYVHKFRSPVYRRSGQEIAVKLISESWFPGCEELRRACCDWAALSHTWACDTDFCLLSTPSRTGQALLWECLPEGVDFPSLSDEMATFIRRNSPQHRIEILATNKRGRRVDEVGGLENLYQYDGRLMYFGASGTDRLPVGEPRPAKHFEPYMPGWYAVRVHIPKTWCHVGLVPRQAEGGAWEYPNKPGMTFDTVCAEPELTIAHGAGWYIEV